MNEFVRIHKLQITLLWKVLLEIISHKGKFNVISEHPKNNLPTELDYGPLSMGCTFYGELPITGCFPPQIFQDKNFFSLCYVA